MITLIDVLKRTRPLTVYENSIINCLISFLITVVIILFSLVYIFMENGIEELVSVVSTVNGISVSLTVWIFILICMFLSGVRYIIRHNKAVKKGIRYSGTVVERKHYFTGARSPVKHRFAIQIDTGKIIKSPVYTDVPEPFKYCDVYFYKKKYYFSGFNWVH